MGKHESCCHHSYHDSCVQALKASGSRVTKQRIAVIDFLHNVQKPMSASEIFSELSERTKVAPLDKVSVYRVLETLHSLKLVHRVPPSGEYIACAHLECENMHHVISRCTECDTIEEVDVPPEVVAPLLFHMKKSLNFTPDSHLLQMDGCCKSCVEQKGS